MLGEAIHPESLRAPSAVRCALYGRRQMRSRSRNANGSEPLATSGGRRSSAVIAEHPVDADPSHREIFRCRPC